MRKLLLLVVVLAGALTFGTTAFADVWTDQEVYFPGDTVNISGDGMEPGESVLVEVFWPDGGLAQARLVDADEQGAFSDSFVLPGIDAPVEGDYTVVATGQTSGNVFTTTFFDPVTVANITVQADDCSTAQTSFNLGDTVCASVAWTTNPGLGELTLKVQWFAPGTFPDGSPAEETISTKPRNSSGTDMNQFTPTSAGTWTVHTCRAASAGSSCAADLDTETFTVTEASSDTTPPVTTITLDPATPDGNNGWYVSDVNVLVSATDDDSGVAETRCVLDPAMPPATFDDIPAGCAYLDPGADVTTDGTHTVYAASIDNEGNKEAPVSVTFKIDQTEPSITITTPEDGAVYTLGQTVNADYSCDDATSGILTCSGTVANGAPIDTATVGAKSFTVNAEDNAGNTNTLTHDYTVSFGICVLYDQTKAHKAGSTVPIKIQLCDASGNNVSDPSITVNAVSLKKVDPNSATAVVEDSGNANPDNNFRYSADLGESGGYIFNLSTKSPSPALGPTTKLSSGTWNLCFFVTGDPTKHCVAFDVK